MSHFAKIENGLVTQVIVAEQDFIDTQEGQWVQTSYNTIGNTHTQGKTPLRGNYAGIGYTYDQTNDVFYAPQPYASWTLDNATWTWQAPTPMPTDGKMYGWDESTQSWLETLTA
jgi:hypothetical protein